MIFVFLLALIAKTTEQSAIDNNQKDCDEDCATTFGIVFGLVFPISGLVIFFIFYCLCLQLKKEKRNLILRDLNQENNSTPENLQFGLEILQNSDWALSQNKNHYLQLKAHERNIKLNYNQKLDKHFIEININKNWISFHGHVKLDKNIWKIYLIQTQKCRYVQRSCCKLSIIVLEGQSQDLSIGFKGRWYLTDVQDFFGTWAWEPLQIDQ
ncbi:unnamed protein product [Paramecium sonneborni]|uniref:Transmembrane protein n=1 Tax=Paramecium sonneborni TaxID=65129 RepID=A0A8S1RM54_9CILI|nr:unnamed protein product [Paramecium sonneborni]